MGVVHASSSGLFDTKIRSVASPKPDIDAIGEDLGKVYTTKSYDIDVSVPSGQAYSLASGSLPPGLSLDSGNAAITGTPTGFSDFDTDNIYNFTLTAYSRNGSASKEFSLNANSIYVGIECFTSGGGVVSGSMPSPYVIKRVDFARWGRPVGSCGSFSNSGCTGGNGCTIPLTGFVGSASFSYNLFSGWCGDPCPGQAKNAHIQFSYGPA